MEKEGHIMGLSPASLEWLKWVLGTFLIAIAGLGIQFMQMKINQASDESNLRVKQLEVDSKLIGTVSNKFETDKDSISTIYRRKELNYLSFVRTFISDTVLRGNIDRRTGLLQQQLNEVKNTLLVSQSNAAAKDSTKLTLQTKQQLKQLAAASPEPKIPQPMAVYYQKESVILTKTNKPESTPVVSKEVQNLNLPATPIKATDDFVLAGPSITQWCKSGYYVEFNNTLRIGVSAVSGPGQTATVNFKDIETSGTNPVEIRPNQTANTLLSANSPITFEYTNPNTKNIYRYTVTLNYVGAGGKNPFTKAAYLTVAAYKKVNQTAP